jgi:hypothetical protein
MSTDPLSQLYKGKCHSQVSQINKKEHEKHLLTACIKKITY